MSKEKIVNIKAVLEDTIKIRTDNGTALPFLGKILSHAVLNPFTRPFRYNYYRLFGSKDLGKAYLDKKKLAFEQNKKGRDTFSYVEASKIVARYTDDAYYPVSEMRKDFAKIFKSFAAHEALEKALERATDYSDDPSIAEIKYSNRGVFSKKPAN
tara:strand:- start:244 stop:708 length:465 start_codon:yes stop_codon:yes gene_type:complete